MTPEKQSLHHRGETIAASTSTNRTSTPTTLASEEDRDDNDPSLSTEVGQDLLAATTANQSTIIILGAGGRGRGGIDPPEVIGSCEWCCRRHQYQ